MRCHGKHADPPHPPRSPASTSRSIHRHRLANRNPSAPGPSPEYICRRRPAEYSCVANSCTSPSWTSRKSAASPRPQQVSRRPPTSTQQEQRRRLARTGALLDFYSPAPSHRLPSSSSWYLACPCSLWSATIDTCNHWHQKMQGNSVGCTNWTTPA
jgi:hypothetical protein